MLSAYKKGYIPSWIFKNQVKFPLKTALLKPWWRAGMLVRRHS
jgi:hypothetical protein